jgi:hypothetical protein
MNARIRRAVMMAASLCLAACFGNSGTVSVGLVTAPESTLLDRVERIRMTLSDPRTVVEALRSDGRFTLSLEAPADGSPGTITVECFDASDQLIGYGASPPFAVGPIDARIAVYIAAPNSMAPAPVKLSVGRFEVGTARLSYGLVVIGGRGNDNAARSEVEIYNAYNHTLARGLDLPAPRAGPAVTSTLDGQAYIFGGFGADSSSQSNAWRFDTRVAPSGAFQDLFSSAAARGGARALPISATQFLVTGEPALIDAITLTVTPVVDAEFLPREAVTLVVSNQLVVIAAGASVVRYRSGTFDVLSVPSALRTGHAMVTTSDGQAAVIGGELGLELTRDAVKIDPISGAATIIPKALETARRRPAVARAGKRIVVAGGIAASGEILSTAEILDGATLAHLATIPMAGPRAAAVADVLPNNQVLLIGGIDGLGRPRDLLELFTPGPDP